MLFFHFHFKNFSPFRFIFSETLPILPCRVLLGRVWILTSESVGIVRFPPGLCSLRLVALQSSIAVSSDFLLIVFDRGRTSIAVGACMVYQPQLKKDKRKGKPALPKVCLCHHTMLLRVLCSAHSGNAKLL